MDVLLVSLEIVRCRKAFRIGAVLDPTFEWSAVCRRMFPSEGSICLSADSGTHDASLLFGLVFEGLAALKTYKRLTV
jgi:hypothetical protein